MKNAENSVSELLDFIIFLEEGAGGGGGGGGEGVGGGRHARRSPLLPGLCQKYEYGPDFQ